jgi:hypothetical protein
LNKRVNGAAGCEACSIIFSLAAAIALDVTILAADEKVLS